jgi:hypothetical protein
MPRLRIGRRSDRATSSIVLLGIGAAVGIALGATLADRIRRGARTRGPSDPFLHAAHGAYDESDDLPAPPKRTARTSQPDERPTRAPSIERRVLEVFRNDPVLAERAIDIGEDQPGVITLTGWVRDEDEIGHATTLAGGVPGVDRVDSGLAVRAPRQPWTLRGSAPITAP